MTIVRATTLVRATPAAVWEVLVDWPGQSRWIPLTTVDVLGDRDRGVGVRAVALSGRRLGRIPVGLLDRFVVTGWTAPTARGSAELEVLHLGPCFTGIGVFRLEPADGGTTVGCTEVFEVPGGGVAELAVRAVLPLMRKGLERSLRGLATLVEAGR